MVKALFLPLMGWAYGQFEAGTKTTEYRVYGVRWNERTCWVGRPVILSLGYGRRRRRLAWIKDFAQASCPPDLMAWERAYGAPPAPGQTIACITLTFSPTRPPDFVMPGPGDGTVLHAWRGRTYFDIPSDLLGAQLTQEQADLLRFVKKGGGDVPEF